MYSFRPEPEPHEREAIVLALDRLFEAANGRPNPYRSEWRRAAFEEGVLSAEEDEPDR
jgi:hypothetical protein